MTPDPIKHLRELLAKSSERPWKATRLDNDEYRIDCPHIGSPCLDSPHNAKLIVAAINALPALLAVAEALAKHKATAEKYMDMSDRQKTTMRGRRLGNQAEAEYHAALAALAHLTPTAPTTGEGDAK